jgi:hypothetical protein
LLAEEIDIERRPKHSVYIGSVLLAVFITVLLVFSAPARAVVVSVSADKSTYSASDSSAVFTVSVNVETNERIPVQNLTLNITGATSKYCVFYPNGTAISGCTYLTITPASNVPAGWNYSEMNGTGYGWNGSSWGNYTTNFSYGYGYGYSATVILEMAYTITWNLDSQDPDDGSYSAYLEAVASGGSKAFTYRNQNAATFTIDRVTESGSRTTRTIASGGALTATPAQNITALPTPTPSFPIPTPTPPSAQEEGLPAPSPTGAAAASPLATPLGMSWAGTALLVALFIAIAILTARKHPVTANYYRNYYRKRRFYGKRR